MSGLSEQSVLQRSSDVLTSEVDGQFVMMDVESGKYFSMNEVASDIWKALEKPIKVADIYAALLKTYDVEESQCREKVDEFLAHLSKQNLLHNVT